MSKFVKYKDSCVVNMDKVAYYNTNGSSIVFYCTDAEEYTIWRLSTQEETLYVFKMIINLTGTVVLKDFEKEQ